MFAKAALPFTAAVSLSFALTTQAPAGAQPTALPGATTNSFPQLQVEAKARAAELRRAWLASGRDLPPATPPAITSGQLLGQSFDVKKQPAAPKVKVAFHTGNAGISSVYFYFYPASSNGQQLEVYHYVTSNSLPVTQGTWVLQDVGDSYNYGSFNPYSSAGKWILGTAYIYDQAGNSTSYDQAQLATLFGCSGATSCITVTVNNGHAPDITPPVISAGKILTRTVSLGAPPPDFVGTLTVSDDISGVRYTWITVCPPGSTTGCAGYSNYTPSPLKSGKNTNYDWVCYGTGHCNTTPPGKWTIYSIGACDVARNCTYDYDTADFVSLFGTSTFKVTN